MRWWINSMRLGHRAETLFTARHPVHAVGPKERAAGALLVPRSLRIAKALHKLIFRCRALSGASRPRLIGKNAAVLAHDRLSSAMIEYTAIFPV